MVALRADYLLFPFILLFFAAQSSSSSFSDEAAHLQDTEDPLYTDSVNITYYYYEAIDDIFDDDIDEGAGSVIGIVLGTVFGILTITWFCVVAQRRNWWIGEPAADDANRIILNINNNDDINNNNNNETPIFLRRITSLSGTAAAGGSIVEAEACIAEATVSPLYIHTCEATFSSDNNDTMTSPMGAAVEIEMGPISPMNYSETAAAACEATEIPVASAI